MEEVIDIIKLQKCTSSCAKFVQFMCLIVSIWILVPVPESEHLILVRVPEREPIEFSSCT
jgi:hypothetical protein